MKKIIYASAIIASMAMVSCGGSEMKRATAFAIDVATKVSNNQKDSVVMLYPDAVKADSLALSFTAENVTIKPNEAMNSFVADFGDGKELIFDKVGEDKLVVTSSKGLFAYPANDVEFAKKTGMWDKSLNDAELADRMVEIDEFRAYLQKTVEVQKPLVLSKGRVASKGEPMTFEYSATNQYTITNISNQFISGSDYEVVMKGVTYPANPFWAEMTTNWVKREKGGDLAPGASVVVSFKTDWYDEINSTIIVYKLSDEQQFEKFFVPQGDEFDRYLETVTPADGNTPSAATEKDGKIKLLGKLNGKQGIKFELDKNFNGFMYYTSQGYNTEIKILGNQIGDRLILEESTNGNHTGTYSGTFDGKVFQGTFTRNSDGKEFPVYLSVI